MPCAASYVDARLLAMPAGGCCPGCGLGCSPVLAAGGRCRVSGGGARRCNSRHAAAGVGSAPPRVGVRMALAAVLVGGRLLALGGRWFLDMLVVAGACCRWRGGGALCWCWRSGAAGVCGEVELLASVCSTRLLALATGSRAPSTFSAVGSWLCLRGGVCCRLFPSSGG